MKTLNRSIRTALMLSLIAMGMAVPSATASWLSKSTGIHWNSKRPARVSVDWHHPRVTDDGVATAIGVTAAVAIAASGGIGAIIIGPAALAP